MDKGLSQEIKVQEAAKQSTVHHPPYRKNSGRAEPSPRLFSFTVLGYFAQKSWTGCVCSYSLNWGTKISVLSKYRDMSLGVKSSAPHSHLKALGLCSAVYFIERRGSFLCF